VLKDMLGSRDVAKNGFDLLQETAQVSKAEETSRPSS
jgi:hypothetical protein